MHHESWEAGGRPCHLWLCGTLDIPLGRGAARGATPSSVERPQHSGCLSSLASPLRPAQDPCNLCITDFRAPTPPFLLRDVLCSSACLTMTTVQVARSLRQAQGLQQLSLASLSHPLRSQKSLAAPASMEQYHSARTPFSRHTCNLDAWPGGCRFSTHHGPCSAAGGGLGPGGMQPGPGARGARGCQARSYRVSDRRCWAGRGERGKARAGGWPSPPLTPH